MPTAAKQISKSQNICESPPFPPFSPPSQNDFIIVYSILLFLLWSMFFLRQYFVFFLPMKTSNPLLLLNCSNFFSIWFFGFFKINLSKMKSSEHNSSNKNVCQSTSGSSKFSLSSKKAWVSHLKGKAWVVTNNKRPLKIYHFCGEV